MIPKSGKKCCCFRKCGCFRNPSSLGIPNFQTLFFGRFGPSMAGTKTQLEVDPMDAGT